MRRRPPRARRILLASAAIATPAWAADYPPVTSRDYALDLHQGAVFGSPRIIGMGGATVALAEAASGLPGNPAAVAVRPQQSTGRWDWDGSFDVVVPTLGSDLDNNGDAETPTSRSRMGSVALLVQHRSWGLGAALSTSTYEIAPAGDALRAVKITAGVLRLLTGWNLADDTMTLGGGLRVGFFSIAPAATPDEPLFDLEGTSLEAGGVLRPGNRNLRLGARLALPVHGNNLEARCDPLNCAGTILPEGANVPWEASAGIAWRVAGSLWNVRPPGIFRDERALLLAADAVLTGPIDRGHGIEAFAQGGLQRSGVHPSLSLRAGAEWECLPGRLRIRAGGYFEPGRFVGVDGRIHGTGGAELRVVSFNAFGKERRLRVSFAFDAAARYGNAGLSFGFWN